MDLSPIYKAVAGGVAGAIVALAARYGFHASPDVVNAVSVIVTAAFGYAVGHLTVFLAPANKPKAVDSTTPKA